MLQGLMPGAVVTGASFAYRYDTGFGTDGLGANFSLLIAGAPVYKSAHLDGYSYDSNRTNYSAPIAVESPALGVVVPPAAPATPPSRVAAHSSK